MQAERRQGARHGQRQVVVLDCRIQALLDPAQKTVPDGQMPKPNGVVFLDIFHFLGRDFQDPAGLQVIDDLVQGLADGGAGAVKRAEPGAAIFLVRAAFLIEMGLQRQGGSAPSWPFEGAARPGKTVRPKPWRTSKQEGQQRRCAAGRACKTQRMPGRPWRAGRAAGVASASTPPESDSLRCSAPCTPATRPTSAPSVNKPLLQKEVGRHESLVTCQHHLEVNA